MVMSNSQQSGWVLLTVLLMLLLVALPLSLLQQEWLYLMRQQSTAIATAQAQLDATTLSDRVVDLRRQDHGE